MSHVGQRSSWLLAILLLLAVGLGGCATWTGEVRRLPVREYRDKMAAGWIGQMAGVAWGGPTEFGYNDRIIPEEKMPAWQPELINGAFPQDDLYVEMTFLSSLERFGVEVSQRQAGLDFANSGYRLWCANAAGRTNLRQGIAPPDSSHPKFNAWPNAIDYQIEADFSGLIAPGMPQVAVALGEKFGRLMNYGDGLYAGQFIGAMYAEAFFEKDIRKVIAAGLQAIPAECQYAEMVRDMLKWSQEHAEWEKTWQLARAKYLDHPDYKKASNGGVDCKINGAFVLMGLLYGQGDPDRTIIIACRCGLDSDCNPSSAAGILFTMLGSAQVPARFTERLDRTAEFNHTEYNFSALLEVCEKLAREFIAQEGGWSERVGDEEYFVIPVKPVTPSPLELSWAPGPIAGSRYTSEELAQLSFARPSAAMMQAVAEFAPGWTVSHCGADVATGLHAEELGRKKVLVTHPLDDYTPCVLSREVAIPADKKTTLKVVVGHHPQGDWELVVRADMRELKRQVVGQQTATAGWLEVSVDLTEFAGRSVLLELYNQATGWHNEGGYWSSITLVSE